MNNAVRRAEIKEYVRKAFLAKFMQMNDIRQNKKLELRGELSKFPANLWSCDQRIHRMVLLEPRLAFNKTVVTRYLISLGSSGITHQPPSTCGSLQSAVWLTSLPIVVSSVQIWLLGFGGRTLGRRRAFWRYCERGFASTDATRREIQLLGTGKIRASPSSFR